MPGSYTIFALQDRPFREPWLNAEFLSTYRGRSLHVDVRAQPSEEVRMDLIPN
jgi:hypothetical protein